MEEYGLIVLDFWDGITFGATAAWEWITGYPDRRNRRSVPEDSWRERSPSHKETVLSQIRRSGKFASTWPCARRGHRQFRLAPPRRKGRSIWGCPTRPVQEVPSGSPDSRPLDPFQATTGNAASGDPQSIVSRPETPSRMRTQVSSGGVSLEAASLWETLSPDSSRRPAFPAPNAPTKRTRAAIVKTTGRGCLPSAFSFGFRGFSFARLVSRFAAERPQAFSTTSIGVQPVRAARRPLTQMAGGAGVAASSANTIAFNKKYHSPFLVGPTWHRRNLRADQEICVAPIWRLSVDYFRIATHPQTESPVAFDRLLTDSEPERVRHPDVPKSQPVLWRNRALSWPIACRSLHRDDDLPLVIPRAKMTKGLTRFAQFVRSVDYRH